MIDATAADALSVSVLAFVTLQRLGELAYARANERRLRELGAKEYAAGHYPFLVGLHALWLAGLWALAWKTPPSLPWLGIFFVLQLLRVWVLLTLRGRWTTRIIVLPGAPLVSAGPYLWLHHPNYGVVAAEIFVLPIAFGLLLFSVVFSLLNAALLTVRIRAEDRALQQAGGGSLGPTEDG